MRISTEHSNQQTVTFSDFSGGLNTTDAVENIAENELAQAINVEIYKGQLKVVAGDTKVYEDISGNFNSIVYDEIESKILLTDDSHKVYLLEDGTLTEKGTLTGTSAIQYAAWEDGVIIASGGKLQYYHGGTLETLANSPDVSRGVFIKQGRIWTFYEDVLKCSKIGDETDWTNDTNDASSSQWLQIGYKDGGNIVGVCSLSSDMLIFKSNHHAYHLAGTYPDWVLSEIGRQIECKGYHNCVALSSSTVALGRTKMQAVNVTDAYGDMMAQEVSQKVCQDITRLPDAVRIRYIPTLNQVWLLTDKSTFLFLDVNNGGWFTRKYNVPVLDAVEADGHVYILKKTGLFVLDFSINSDDGRPMLWKFQPKTLVAKNNYLIKRIIVDTVPTHTNYATEKVLVGRVTLDINQPVSAYWLYQNGGSIYGNEQYADFSQKNTIHIPSESIRYNEDELYESTIPLLQYDTYRSEVRCVDREKAVTTKAWGKGGITVFNSISFDIAEV